MTQLHNAYLTADTCEFLVWRFSVCSLVGFSVCVCMFVSFVDLFDCLFVCVFFCATFQLVGCSHRKFNSDKGQDTGLSDDEGGKQQLLVDDCNLNGHVFFCIFCVNQTLK